MREKDVMHAARDSNGKLKFPIGMRSFRFRASSELSHEMNCLKFDERVCKQKIEV